MSEKLGAFVGKIAFVDLTQKTVTVADLPREWAEKYIGGQGIATRLCYDLIPDDCDPYGPENRIVMSAGTFINTMVPGASKLLLNTKGPLNRRYATSSSGIFADKLKAGGFDHVVVSGVSDRPVYLLIDDGEITIHDASHLWGLDTRETTEALWAEQPGGSVITIGPAGERMAPNAIVLGQGHSTSGSGGLGAIFGSKKLKAVVARGSHPVHLADANRFHGLAAKTIKDVMAGPYVPWWRELGTLVQLQEFAGPGAVERTEKMGLDIRTWTDIYRNKVKDRSMTCPGCPVACKQQIGITEGDHAGKLIPMSCSLGTLTAPFLTGAGIPLDHYDEAIICAEMCNRLGISTLSDAISWIHRLYEDGVFTKEDTDGLDLSKGNYKDLQEFIRQVAYGYGFGGELAKPFEEVQEAYRPQLDRYYAWKGHVLRKESEAEGGRHWGKRWSVLFFSHVIDPRADGPGTAYGSPTWMPGRSGSSLKRYGRAIGIPDEEIDKIFTGETDGYDTGLLTHRVELYNLILYSLGTCQRSFISHALPTQRIAQLYTYGTGVEVTQEDLLESAERIITLQRMFNLREGYTRDREVYPAGYLDEREERELNACLDAYYGAHGWDIETGIPTDETLDRLGISRERDPRTFEMANGPAVSIA